MRNSNITRKVLCSFFCIKLKSMVKPKIPKVFKLKKDKETGSLIVRHKNLSKQQLKEFKGDLDEYCQAYFSEPKDD